MTPNADPAVARIQIEHDARPLLLSHNMPCPICWNRKAMFNCQSETFGPCGKCAVWWETRRVPWYRRLFRNEP